VASQLPGLPLVAVVLVEPAGPRNVGGVARALANFGGDGLQLELRLVAPRCDHRGDEARLMAVSAADLLLQARLFGSLADALADCRRVVATSGRGEGEPMEPQDPDTALAWLLQAPAATAALAASAASAPSAAVVFGREDRGLSRAELLMAGRLLRIETGPAYGSLNLAQAAAVVLQRLRVLAMASSPAGALAKSATHGAPSQSEPARRQGLEDLLADAEALLLEVGFLHCHTTRARMAKVRGLLQRGQINDEEVALLRGMVRQLRWASRRVPSPGQTP
jgi:tRNA/rRNA methyltransferase